MPYVHGVGFVLSPAQEALRQTMIAMALVLREIKAPVTYAGYKIGILVQPAHTIERGTIAIPERRFVVRYQPNYGVVCHELCTSNGTAWMIAACVRDDTTWEPRPDFPQGYALVD